MRLRQIPAGESPAALNVHSTDSKPGDEPRANRGIERAEERQSRSIDVGNDSFRDDVCAP